MGRCYRRGRLVLCLWSSTCLVAKLIERDEVKDGCRWVQFGGGVTKQERVATRGEKERIGWDFVKVNFLYDWD